MISMASSRMDSGELLLFIVFGVAITIAIAVWVFKGARITGDDAKDSISAFSMNGPIVSSQLYSMSASEMKLGKCWR